jgi:drug/metabolite transporter (DMT)-like permease
VIPIALATAILAVSCSAILIRWAEAPPLTVAANRMLLALLLLVPVVAWRERASFPRIAKRHFRWTAIGGAFLAVHFGAWTASLSYTTVASSVLLVSTHPVFVAFAEWRLLHQRPSSRTWLGASVTLLGSLVVGGGDLASQESGLAGDALALLGALAMVGYLLVGRRLRPVVESATYSLLIYAPCWLFLSLAALVLGDRPWQFAQKDLAVFFGLALISTIGGHTLFSWALRHVSATAVAAAFVGEPVVASLLAWPILGEQPTPTTLFGGAIVLGGIYLATTGQAIAAGPGAATGDADRDGARGSDAGLS